MDMYKTVSRLTSENYIMEFTNATPIVNTTTHTYHVTTAVDGIPDDSGYVDPIVIIYLLCTLGVIMFVAWLLLAFCGLCQGCGDKTGNPANPEAGTNSVDRGLPTFAFEIDNDTTTLPNADVPPSYEEVVGVVNSGFHNATNSTDEGDTHTPVMITTTEGDGDHTPCTPPPAYIDLFGSEGTFCSYQHHRTSNEESQESV